MILDPLSHGTGFIELPFESEADKPNVRTIEVICKQTPLKIIIINVRRRMALLRTRILSLEYKTTEKPETMPTQPISKRIVPGIHRSAASVYLIR
jgi:hypothetical protein